MYTTKSGKKYGSAMVGKRKDAMGSEENAMGPASKENNMGPKSTDMMASAKKPMEPKEESKTDSMGEANKNSSMPNEVNDQSDSLANPEGVDAGAVAKEHGPATSVTTHHSADKHVVISRHPSGHMNMSQHASHAEAHEAAKQLSGPQHEENTDKEPNADAEGESDGFLMPRLA